MPYKNYAERWDYYQKHKEKYKKLAKKRWKENHPIKATKKQLSKHPKAIAARLWRKKHPEYLKTQPSYKNEYRRNTNWYKAGLSPLPYKKKIP